MILDPYKTLNVDPGVSDGDLKKAYRELSKKYHPDANPDDREASEEKFKEIQEAYRQIVSARERGSSGYGYQYQQAQQSGQSAYQDQDDGYAEYEDFFGGFGSFSDFFNEWREQANAQQESNVNEPLEMRAAANYINSGHYYEAINALSNIPAYERSAKWYYYSAVANSRIGNNATALQHARTACDMDPDNWEYFNYLRNLQQGGTWYHERGSSYGPITFNTGWCLSLCALNALCGLCMRPC